LEIKLRQRLIGAVVLAALVVIFVPAIFKPSSNTTPKSITLSSTIPPNPAKPMAQAITSAQDNTLSANDNSSAPIITTNNSNNNNPSQIALGNTPMPSNPTVGQQAQAPIANQKNEFDNTHCATISD